MSADNTIVAYFGSSATATACPSRNECVATAPAGLTGTVPVRVHTESGTSNAKSFSYTR
jgi:hypothetical protein